MSQKTEHDIPHNDKEAAEWANESIKEMADLHLKIENQKALKELGLNEQLPTNAPV